MTSRYRVEYALKTHRRDQLIEWIKGLLAVPFVLHSQPTAVFEPTKDSIEQMAEKAHRRYAEIMRDVEELINDHILHQSTHPHLSKLKLLVPTIGTFFTPLLLHDAFIYQDSHRRISFRRFVPPSFNDIRLTLNTAQIMSLISHGPLELVTFDGDVTLYDDGHSLAPENPVIERILGMMAQGTKVGIVTAAGYVEARRYYERLYGLLDALQASTTIPESQKSNLVIMGGESNFCFRFSSTSPDLLAHVPAAEWMLDEMQAWTEADMTLLLDVAEGALRENMANMHLPGTILRKERAVGLIPSSPTHRFPREQLEETVLSTQKTVEMHPVGRRLPFTAFNGGNDVFVDIGDKSIGVQACQRVFGGVEGGKTLHVGDQFLSLAGNDFKARLACTTAWIASPAETCALLDEIQEHGERLERKVR